MILVASVSMTTPSYLSGVNEQVYIYLCKKALHPATESAASSIIQVSYIK